MGLFSWNTQDTNRSIPSRLANERKCFTVYMIDNAGHRWQEDRYEGYGVFGGKDYYELLAEMNGKKTRVEGIDLAFEGNQKDIIYPNLAEYPNWKWVPASPEICKYQGYFYPPTPDIYLGDSVYVAVRNGQIILTTDNGEGPSNTIYLEKQVATELFELIGNMYSMVIPEK